MDLTVACLSGSPEKDISSSNALNNICLIMFCNFWTLCMSTCAKLFFKFALCMQALDNKTFLKNPLSSKIKLKNNVHLLQCMHKIEFWKEGNEKVFPFHFISDITN